jgi:replication-associated recombination protein RarA
LQCAVIWSDEAIPRTPVRADLRKKMVFWSGPRQIGKTTLARAIAAGYADAR